MKPRVRVNRGAPRSISSPRRRAVNADAVEDALLEPLPDRTGVQQITERYGADRRDADEDEQSRFSDPSIVVRAQGSNGVAGRERAETDSDAAEPPGLFDLPDVPASSRPDPDGLGLFGIPADEVQVDEEPTRKYRSTSHDGSPDPTVELSTADLSDVVDSRDTDTDTGTDEGDDRDE